MRCSAAANSRKQTANTRQIKLRINFSSTLRTNPKNIRTNPKKSAAGPLRRRINIVLHVRRHGKPKGVTIPGPMDIGRRAAGRRCPSRRRFVVWVHSDTAIESWAIQYDCGLPPRACSSCRLLISICRGLLWCRSNRNMGSIKIPRNSKKTKDRVSF
jgi:hypothetical protein